VKHIVTKYLDNEILVRKHHRMTTYRLTEHETLHVVASSPEAIEVEAHFQPGGKPPPAHRHPAQHERFEVLEGTLHAVVDGDERELRAGDTLEIPLGVAHKMHAGGDGPARVRWVTTPRLRTHDMWAAMTEAHDRAGGRPPLPALARVLLEHDAEFQLVLPGGVGPVALRALAAVPVAR
jgi:quercetin dioxygenase-like cupin family protein